MAESKVVIHDYKLDPNTGRVELHLKTQNTEGTATWEGPVKQYSCDQHMLRDRFNGNIEEFEAWCAREHQQLTGVHPDLHATLAARKGKVIG